jgi:thioredoxin 2
VTRFVTSPARHAGQLTALARRSPPNRRNAANVIQALFTGKPAAADVTAFERHITRNDVPVVVDFWASWCRPCLAIAPAYERAAAELEPHFRLLKVNADEEQQLMAKYGIRSIPTLMLFAKGQPVAQNAGAMNTHDIVAWVRSHASSD